jgi:type IV pilus assembly protein PilP
MRGVGIAVILVAAGLLGACSDEQQELRSWMDEQRAAITPVIEKITPPKAFEPFRYENEGLADPFAQSRLAFRANGEPKSGGRTPDLARKREVLEAFPLESIKMVGHMSNNNANFALLQVENMVYQARVGNYAGQNFGKIVRVNEGEVVLKEMVQDAAGDWNERDTALRLQETKK